jgi:hypothetical protein
MNGSSFFAPRSIPALVSFSLACSACARPPARAPVSNEPAANERAIQLSYSVARREEPKRPLIAGHSEVGSSSLQLESVDSARHLDAKLKLSANARPDGTVIVYASYAERDGSSKIEWAPSVRLARGGTAIAEVAGDGWGRELRIGVE